MEKYGRARQTTDDNSMGRITDTHLEYVILIAFPCKNGYANAPLHYIIRTLPVLLTLALAGGGLFASRPGCFPAGERTSVITK